MKTKAFIFTALLVFSAFAGSAQRDSRFNLELSGGPSLALSDLAGTDLNLGGGFEAVIQYRFMPHTGIYTGWGWNKLPSENNFAGTKVDFEETGYIFGLFFRHPVGSSNTSFYVRGGGLYNHLEVENEEGKIIGDTGNGLGWQLGTGIYLPLSKKLSFMTGLKYNSLNRDLSLPESGNTDLNLRYLNLKVGLDWRL